MKIKSYLKQTCVWQKRIPEGSTDQPGWGGFEYEPAQTIRCRKTVKKKQVNNKAERTYVDVSVYWTEVEISIGDIIDGEEIMAVQNEVGFDGRVVYWESNPRPPLGFTP